MNEIERLHKRTDELFAEINALKELESLTIADAFMSMQRGDLAACAKLSQGAVGLRARRVAALREAIATQAKVTKLLAPTLRKYFPAQAKSTKPERLSGIQAAVDKAFDQRSSQSRSELRKRRERRQGTA